MMRLTASGSSTCTADEASVSARIDSTRRACGRKWANARRRCDARMWQGISVTRGSEAISPGLAPCQPPHRSRIRQLGSASGIPPRHAGAEVRVLAWLDRWTRVMRLEASRLGGEAVGQCELEALKCEHLPIKP